MISFLLLSNGIDKTSKEEELKSIKSSFSRFSIS